MTLAAAAGGRRHALCIRPRPRAGVAGFLGGIADEWIGALSLHCDVSLVEEDCDYAALCDRVRPDFVLFEGLTPARPVPLNIANLDAYPVIPRAAFLAGDPHDCLRPLIFKMVQDFRVEAIFAYGYEYLQQMPELGAGVFSVSVFIDDAIYRDYGLPKPIPISIFGGRLEPAFYPWRAEMCDQLPLRFPTLIYTHPGYGASPSHTYAVTGEAYARILNQSYYSLADTTRLHFAVRKHLEIPASGAVLVAPNTPPLADYGFVDMVNCILGTGRELYGKIGETSRNHELYERIRRAGHDLVHSRHLRRHWRYIVDWYECHRLLRPGEVVQQIGQYGPFRAAPAGSQTSIQGLSIPENELTAVLRAAREAILRDEALEAAASRLRDAAVWAGHITESWFLLALTALLRGEADAAHGLITRSYETQRARQGFVFPDPVELAWLLLIAHIRGDAGAFKDLQREAAETSHLSLRRARFLLSILDGGATADTELDARLPDDRLSIHWIGQEDYSAWCGLASRILAANGIGLSADQAVRLRNAGHGVEVGE